MPALHWGTLPILAALLPNAARGLRVAETESAARHPMGPKTCEMDHTVLQTTLGRKPSTLHMKPEPQIPTKHRRCDAAKDKLWLIEPLLLPEYKLAFCYVPKAACSQFKDLFNTINKRGPWNLGFGRGYTASMPQELHIDMKDVTKEKGWKFATFTRDPITRYVSAFGSTCVPKSDGWYEHAFACCGDLVGHTEARSRTALQRILKERVQHDLEMGTPYLEDHWSQQTDVLRNCGWDKFAPDKLDYWGHLSGNVTQQVIDMMSMVGYSNTSVIENLFPDNHVAGHQNTMHGSAADFVRDWETVKGIMQIYEEDYRLIPGIGCSYSDALLQRDSQENPTPAPWKAWNKGKKGSSGSHGKPQSPQWGAPWWSWSHHR